MTDWEWFLSSEAGRDRILRGEIEGLHASASSARAQSARLSSQLTQLQGSLETRLSALSRAFDAYVELGDVREQLDGYPDTSAVRRDAVAAIDVLSRGGSPQPVEHRGLDYWLSYAVNAVITLVRGDADPAEGSRAVELSPEAELFIVAAAGALGSGAAVAPRLAPLLICDGALAPRQLVLWQAVLAGVYGPSLAEVRAVWGPMLDKTADSWTAWVRAEGRTVSATGSLRWLDALISTAATTGAPADPAPSDGAGTDGAGTDGAGTDGAGTDGAGTDGARAGLRTVVIGLVGQGMGDEAALLARSRVLRARIEDPTGPVADELPEVPDRGVTEVVQEALLAAPAGSALRHELIGWVVPGLIAAAEHFGAAAQVLPPALVKVATEGGDVEVSPEGATPDRVARAEQTIGQLTDAPLRRLLPAAVVAGVFAVLSFVTVLNGHPRGALLLLLAAGVAALVVAYLAADRRRTLYRRGEMLEGLRASLAGGQREAVELRGTQQTAAVEAAAMAALVRDQLRNAAPGPGPGAGLPGPYG